MIFQKQDDIERWVDSLRTIVTFLSENQQYGDDWEAEICSCDEMIAYFLVNHNMMG